MEGVFGDEEGKRGEEGKRKRWACGGRWGVSRVWRPKGSALFGYLLCRLAPPPPFSVGNLEKGKGRML